MGKDTTWTRWMVYQRNLLWISYFVLTVLLTETWWILNFNLAHEKIPFWEYTSISIFSDLCVLTVWNWSMNAKIHGCVFANFISSFTVWWLLEQNVAPLLPHNWKVILGEILRFQCYTQLLLCGIACVVIRDLFSVFPLKQNILKHRTLFWVSVKNKCLLLLY